MNNLNNAVTRFQAAMLDQGITPPDTLVGDSVLHRFYVEGDRKGTLNGAYTLHLDAWPSGWAMNFKAGVSFTWTLSGKKEPLTPAVKRQIDYAKEVRQLEQAKAHQAAALKAYWIWQQAEPITDPSQHPYLVRKRVQPHGTRLYKGSLAIPLVDETGQLVNIQFIHADGTKRFLSGGKKKTCYHLLGGDGSKLLVAEGFATACSINEQTLYAVYVAFDCGNLKDVAVLAAKQAAKSNLSTEVIVCGDNDVSGIGQKAAREAALACGGKFIVPPNPDTDFNDYVCNGGVIHG